MSEFEVSNWSFGDALVRTLRTLQKGALNERTLSDENVWFVAKGVAAALEYRTADDMTRYLDDDEITKCPVQTQGGMQEMIVISESGLYHAIFQSRKEAAKAFRRWVTSEVLPQIRRTGGYRLDEFGIPEEHGALTQRMFTARMKKAVGLEGKNADVIFMDGMTVRALKHWSIRAAEEKLPSGCIPEGNVKEIILDE